MAQVITIAGERLFALKAQNNEQLDVDTFIFANVPGQDPNAPIDRNEGLPPVAQRVHQQIVQQVGRVNDNVVIYSTVMDSVTGPFDFNWVGLYSSVNQTLIAVSHIPSVSKTVTVPGAAGNTLNRNFGIEYSGIADLTGITVAPETWQLDFTARLSGMDELTRQLAADMNGKDWFIGDGFKVVPRSTANTFKVTPGAGYVSGLRVELKQDHILTLQSYPQFVYVDAWFDGDASSQWKPKTAFTVTNGEMDDYIDVNGKQHYVFKLAVINAGDEVEDLRTAEGLRQEIDRKLDKEVGPVKIQPGRADNILKRRKDAGPTREHMEPNGHVDSGTVTKLDLMLDPYEDDPVNYRIVNLYTKTGNTDGANGENGVAVLGVKAVGDHFGVWPSLHFAFSDDNAGGCAAKMYYFDTSDTEWRVPQRGAWRQGMNINEDDYILANYRQYKALNSGITGDVKPDHLAGEASDGNINWLMVRDFSAKSNSIKPLWFFGDRDDMPVFGYPKAGVQTAKDELVLKGAKKIFLDDNNNQVASIYTTTTQNDAFLNIELQGGGLFRFSKNGKYYETSGLAKKSSVKAFTGGETVIDVTATELVSFGNSSGTVVTQFTGVPYQTFKMFSSNGQTTIQSNSYIKLKDNTDYQLQNNHCVEFIFDGSGTVCRQVL